MYVYLNIYIHIYLFRMPSKLSTRKQENESFAKESVILCQ